MFGPDWEEGCPSCSFWTDSFDGVGVHLAHRDVTFVRVSRAPLDKLAAYQRRMGWTFAVVLLGAQRLQRRLRRVLHPGPAGERRRPTTSPTRTTRPTKHPASAPSRSDDGDGVPHLLEPTAAASTRFNGAYQLLDLAPKGRDEDDLEWPMAWLRRHDAYDD